MVISINKIVYTSKFEHDVKKVNDKSFKEKIQKNHKDIRKPRNW